MDDDGPIIVLGGSEGAHILDNHHIERMEVKLDIFGKSLHICIGVENKSAKLSDLLPLAWLLSTKIISITRQHIINNGDIIPCRPFCSQCCRYLVPLSIPEAMRLSEEVTAMAQSKRTFLNKSCLLTAKRILELTSKSFFEKLTKTNSGECSKLKHISDWYSRMNLPCPFLLDDLCIIYEQKPIVCREYMVTGSASNCKVKNTNQEQIVQIPVSIFEVLAQLTSELEQTTVETIILPFALVWCLENPEYFKHTWPASQLVRGFINILITQNRYNNKPTSQKTDDSYRNQEPLTK